MVVTFQTHWLSMTVYLHMRKNKCMEYETVISSSSASSSYRPEILTLHPLGFNKCTGKIGLSHNIPAGMS